MSSGSFRSVVELFWQRVDSTPDGEAMMGLRGDRWYSLRWSEVGDRARALACGLMSLGLERGVPCALLCRTRPEWVILDHAILSAGGVTCALYPEDTRDGWAWIIQDSGARIGIAEDRDQAQALLDLPGLEVVIQIAGKPAEGALLLESIERSGRDADRQDPSALDQRIQSIGPDELASLIYTAGTTGPPKGVMITHDCWVYEAEAIDAADLLRPSDRQLLFLPLAHAFARVLAIAFVRMGVPTALHHRLSLDALAAVRPTVMAGVPRTFERLRESILAWGQRGPLRARRLARALSRGGQLVALQREGRGFRGLLAAEHAISRRALLPQLRGLFGGEIRYFISGGAPLPEDLARFFHALELPVMEGYGLTESSAASCVNRPDQFRIGTVGPPLPGTEIAVDERGEILIRGRGVMKGYLNRPEETASALEGGWLRTGDIGQLEDGFLRITGRRKEIIVTSGGKNVAPEHIEQALAESPWVQRAILHGDGRPWCVALIELDETAVRDWARDLGLRQTDLADLAAHPGLRNLVWADVQSVNRGLPAFESVRQIHLLPRALSREEGELTPTGEVKRRAVEMRYKEALSALYPERAEIS